jgi:hypothetical protein
MVAGAEGETGDNDSRTAFNRPTNRTISSAGIQAPAFFRFRRTTDTFA